MLFGEREGRAVGGLEGGTVEDENEGLEAIDHEPAVLDSVSSHYLWQAGQLTGPWCSKANSPKVSHVSGPCIIGMVLEQVSSAHQISGRASHTWW